MRIRLGDVLFRNVSLVRRNQIDSVLSTPKSHQLYSDKRTYHREFVKELICVNIDDCSKSDLARSSFKNHFIGDRSFKCYYEDRLCMGNFVRYLECDNEVLKSADLNLFPNITELKVLDECADSTIETKMELPKLDYLAVHAQSLQSSEMLLSSLCNLSRLDLFLNYSDVPSTGGIRRILNHLMQRSPAFVEVALFLEQPFNLAYSDTISLLKLVSSSARLQKLTIRVERRKNSQRQGLEEHQLYSGYIGDDVLKVFQKVEQVILDVSIMDVIKFNPRLNLTVRTNIPTNKNISLVDKAVMVPKMTVTQKDVLGTIIRTCGFASFSFYYGEALEESHLQVLNIVTDFVRWMLDPIANGEHIYLGLKRTFVEKCWSVTDDSVNREYLTTLMESGKDEVKVDRFKVWDRIPVNSPRYRKRETFDLFYEKQSQYDVVSDTGYYIGRSNMPIDAEKFVTSQDLSSECLENYFWSTEASLCDFEQYCIRQRRSLLFG
ncbi:hypothetical protein CANMA_005302 [Candida margitis]|uniref:uncharacterized protein n=1 Tax=Candida margitis TaxID=1775924 RepID=UPI00222681BE|nr:uncharacterized protein CANMA_005302 [Candida margitis]KAI5950642.1 hypothetical protein CANMA_005302 [Candida margitis]